MGFLGICRTHQESSRESSGIESGFIEICRDSQKFIDIHMDLLGFVGIHWDSSGLVGNQVGSHQGTLPGDDLQ